MKKLLTIFIFSAILLNITGCKVKLNTDSSNLINDNSQIEENNEDDSENQEAKNEKSENQKKVVVIDPGHAVNSNLEKEQESPDSDKMKIKDGGGAEGISSKTPEYEINMKVANKLKSMLEEKNVTVVMTKTNNEVSLGNIERADIGNENNADLVIRIHCDSSLDNNKSGSSMLVPAKIGYASPICDISKQYGEIILNSLVLNCDSQNRGVVERDDMTGFNWSRVPVVLVEMGFLSNPYEDALLNTDDYQNKLAQGLCNGIVKSLDIE